MPGKFGLISTSVQLSTPSQFLSESMEPQPVKVAQGKARKVYFV